jgi:hypothetical protein
VYTKLFVKILDSSIWLETSDTRVVWLTLLAAMDEDGYCQFASAGNLAQRAIVSRESAEKAIAILEAPDCNSSDPDNNGKRIERVPGGWMVLNAKKYSEIAKRDQMRESTRIRVARHRERNADVTPCNTSVRESTLLELDLNLDTLRSKPLASSDKRSQPEVTVFDLPLVDGSDYGVPQSLYDEYVRAYPAISVMGELNQMRIWLLSNPKHKKTRTGITRFMCSWLSRSQNKAPVIAGTSKRILAPVSPNNSFAARNS